MLLEDAAGGLHSPRGARHAERREARRFPLIADVRWRPLSSRTPGTMTIGKTLNMSSRGILFTTPEFLNAGSLLEVNVAWPIKLDSICSLKLVVRGRVIRSDGITAALRITRYEFRTCKTNTASA